jgi:hypothetical protein
MKRALRRSRRLGAIAPVNKATLLAELADAVRFAPKRGDSQAARLLESYLGLVPVDYADAPQMCAALEHAGLDELGTHTAAKLLRVLAQALHMAPGRGSTQAACLLESYLGLNASDYATLEGMRLALSKSQPLTAISVNSQIGLLSILADALVFVTGRGRIHTARLLEAYVGLAPEDYGDTSRLRAVLDSAPPLAQLNSAVLVQSLAEALRGVSERGSGQAVRLLESYLGLAHENYVDGPQMQIALRRSSRLTALEANNRTTLVRVLADALRVASGRGSKHADRLMESYLAEYGHWKRRGIAPGEWRGLAGVTADNQAVLFISLAESIAHSKDRGTFPLSELIESFLGLCGLDYQDSASMRAALDRSRLRELEANNSAVLLEVLARNLCRVPGRGIEAPVILLETYLGLTPADYATTIRVQKALADSSILNDLSLNNRMTLIEALSDAVSRVPGRGAVEGTLLLECYLGVPMFEFTAARAMQGVSALNVLTYIHMWLSFANGGEEAAFAVCRAVVGFIRSLREDVLPTYASRVEFLNEARRLWDQVQRIALERVEHEQQTGYSVPDGRERLLLEFLAWAEQFHNRLLVERLFVDPVPAGSDGAAALQGWKPGQLALWRQERSDDDVTSRQEYSATAVASCLGECPTQCEDVGREEPMVRDVAREFRKKLLAPEGDEPELRDLVPQGCVWVRVLFDHVGRLHWWAWQRPRDELILLADGVSAPGAERELQISNIRFDLEVERVWAAFEGRTLDLEDEALLEQVLSLFDHAGQPEKSLTNPGGNGVFCGQVDKALTRLKDSAPFLANLGRGLLRAALDPSRTTEAWMIEDFRNGLAMLRQPWGPRVARSPAVATREERRRQALDDASRRHLEVPERHFDLRSLWWRLPSDQWAETDILFQTPGPLLAAPLAWLPFAPAADGQVAPLLQSVASTGSTVSLTLRWQAEQQASRPRVGEQLPPLPQRRILTVHWGGRDTGAGMFRLQSQVVQVGQECGWEVWCLGNSPQATADNLRAALDDPKQGFRVLVLNAHGIREKFGVKLAPNSELAPDSEWCGAGSNLRATDLIVLAACSVGRLCEDSGRDVEGLCAELAAHHARTVVAARWLIADSETAELTSEFLHQYLEAVGNRGDLTPPAFARARALNRACRRLLETGAITFHLAAAFQIYGLG